MSKELYFGFVTYSEREFIPQPVRCFKCGHTAEDCAGCGAGVSPECCHRGGEQSVVY